MKIKKTAKISFIYFPVIGIIFVGSLYTYFDQKLFYLVILVLLAEVLFIAYAAVLAMADPEKVAMKKQKKEAEAVQDTNVVTKQALDEQAAHFEKLLKTNRELVEKASQFFKEEDSLTGFLEYFNNLITEKTSADGCAILVYDEFDNILSVKSVKGTFPPPYKLPEDLPHKAIRVETNFRYSNFPLEGNPFGDFFSAGEPVNVKDSIKDHRIYQNGPEEFLRCGP